MPSRPFAASAKRAARRKWNAYQATCHSSGYPFFSMYNYVMNTPEAAEKLAISPAQVPAWATFVAAIFGGWAPVLATIVTLAVPLWVMNGLPVYMMVPSRITFALAFDRFFPERMAEVNARFRTPHVAILVSVIGGIIMMFLMAYSP